MAKTCLTAKSTDCAGVITELSYIVSFALGGPRARIVIYSRGVPRLQCYVSLLICLGNFSFHTPRLYYFAQLLSRIFLDSCADSARAAVLL